MLTSLQINRSRNGLTLLELVIVMTILAALAGIAVAMFPRLMNRAHIATCSANLPELAKAIQMYEATSMDGYPDRMDTLVVSGGGGLAPFLPLRNGGIAGVTVGPLTEDEVEALHEAGIRQVTVMSDGGPDWHPSFWPYGTPLADGPPLATIDDSTQVAFLDAFAAQQQGISTNGPEDRFVVFGLGSPCRMFGRTLNEAPVHFSDSLEGNPNQRYMRFVAVYQVAGHVANPAWVDGVDDPDDQFIASPYRRARFRGVLSMHPGRLEGVGAHTEEFWDEVEADQVQ